MKKWLSLFLFVQLLHADPWYKDHVISWWGTSKLDKEFVKLCEELQTKPEFAGVQCRYAGNLDRDSSFGPYAQWFQNNINPQALDRDLLPRDSLTRKLIETKGTDDLFLCDEQARACLYLRNSPHPKSELLRSGDLNADDLRKFLLHQRNGVEVRPDSAELERLKFEPDSSYQFQPTTRSWMGISMGQSLGLWYQDGVGFDRDLMGNKGADSSKLWNWMEPARINFNVAIGREHSGLFSYALFGGYSENSARLRPEAQTRVQSWTWKQWWFGVNLRLGYTYLWLGQEWFPHLSMGLSQHRFKEKLELSQVSILEQNHLEFPSLKGADISLGLRCRTKMALALNYEAGFEHLSRSSNDNFQGEQSTPIADNSSSLFHRIWIEWDFN